MRSRSRHGDPRSAAARPPASTDLDRGRAVYGTRRWREAADRLAAADRADPLAADDLERLAWSYGLSGHTDLLLATLERIHDLELESGDLRQAARAAFW